jgi:hypothetical protein
MILHLTTQIRLLTLSLAGAVIALLPILSDAGQQTTNKEVPPNTVKAETNPLSFWDGRLILDIEERMRGEIRENNRDFDSSIKDDNDDSWLLNRFRLGLTLKPVWWLKVYGQTQDAREAFSDRSNIPGVRGAEGDDSFDLRQASISLGDAKQFPLVLTIGRQAISYGDGRLVADSRWGNLGRTFDAIRLRFEEPKYWLEAFAMRPVQIERHEFNPSDSEDNFGGLYFSTTIIPKQTTDLYFYYRDKQDNQPDLDPTNKVDPEGSFNGPAASFATLGLRIKSSPDKWDGWDYSAEFAYEVGDLYVTDRNSPRSHLSAFALAASGGYTLTETLWKPRFGLEYDFALGDDNPNDGDSHSFQTLYPSGHDKYGLMDEFGWRNLHDLRAQVNLQPTRELGLEAHFHTFFLADTSDYWYRSNGISVLRTKTPDGRDVRTIGADNFAGNEIDFIATYDLTRNIKVQAGYSHFFAGAYLADTGASSDADFGFLMTTFSF